MITFINSKIVDTREEFLEQLPMTILADFACAILIGWWM